MSPSHPHSSNPPADYVPFEPSSIPEGHSIPAPPRRRIRVGRASPDTIPLRSYAGVGMGLPTSLPTSAPSPAPCPSTAADSADITSRHFFPARPRQPTASDEESLGSMTSLPATPARLRQPVESDILRTVASPRTLSGRRRNRSRRSTISSRPPTAFPSMEDLTLYRPEQLVLDDSDAVNPPPDTNATVDIIESDGEKEPWMMIHHGRAVPEDQPSPTAEQVVETQQVQDEPAQGLEEADHDKKGDATAPAPRRLRPPHPDTIVLRALAAGAAMIAKFKRDVITSTTSNIFRTHLALDDASLRYYAEHISEIYIEAARNRQPLAAAHEEASAAIWHLINSRRESMQGDRDLILARATWDMLGMPTVLDIDTLRDIRGVLGEQPDDVAALDDAMRLIRSKVPHCISHHETQGEMPTPDGGPRDGINESERLKWDDAQLDAAIYLQAVAESLAGRDGFVDFFADPAGTPLEILSPSLSRTSSVRGDDEKSPLSDGAASDESGGEDGDDSAEKTSSGTDTLASSQELPVPLAASKVLADEDRVANSMFDKFNELVISSPHPSPDRHAHTAAVDGEACDIVTAVLGVAIDAHLEETSAASTDGATDHSAIAQGRMPH